MLLFGVFGNVLEVLDVWDVHWFYSKDGAVYTVIDGVQSRTKTVTRKRWPGSNAHSLQNSSNLDQHQSERLATLPRTLQKALNLSE